jgi:PmbA protein
VGGYPYSRHSCRWRRSPARARHAARRLVFVEACAEALAEPEAIGRYAAERALARLNARKLSTRKCPVLFEAPLAAGLLGAFVQAVSGGALYRKSTFLSTRWARQVFAAHPDSRAAARAGRMGSAPFDEEGVRTHARDVVRDGVVQGYFLSTYSARKLGMKTTGNAGGSHNLTLTAR